MRNESSDPVYVAKRSKKVAGKGCAVRGSMSVFKIQCLKNTKVGANPVCLECARNISGS